MEQTTNSYLRTRTNYSSTVSAMGITETPEQRALFREKGIWPVGARLINGMYEVLPLSETATYAEGGVGVVQRVRHRDWDMELAVKSPKPGTLQTENGKLNFEHECRTWIDLGIHPNIVNCYLVRRIDDVPRLFAEFVSDGSLRDWIADGRLYQGGRAVALARILDIAIQYAWGVDHAHSQGLLHLDLKPGNVMMSGETAKVTDFGLAKSFGQEMGMQGGMLCEGMTPAYCSPEQFASFQQYRKTTAAPGSNNETEEQPQVFEDVPVTKKSDIWSWGVSLIAMFFGRAPCKKGGQTAAEVFEAFLRHNPAEQYPLFPNQLVDIMRRCFRAKPDERPASMQEIADVLIRTYGETTGNSYPRRKPKIGVRTPEVISNHGASLLDLDQPDEALALFNEALSSNKWHPQILFNKLMTEWRYGRISDLEIEARLEEALRLNPRDVNALYVCGLFLRERGNVKQSRSLLERAYELSPNRDDIANAFRLSIRQLKQEVHRAEPIECCGYSDALPAYIDLEQKTILINVKPLMQGVPQVYRIIALKDGEIKATFTQKSNGLAENLGDPDSIPLAINDEQTLQINSEIDGTITVHLLVPGTKKADKSRASLKYIPLPWGSSKRCADNRHRFMFSVKDHAIAVKSVETGKLIGNYFDHEQDISLIAVSGDSKWLVTAAADNSIRLWEVKTHRCLRTLRKASRDPDKPLPKIKGVWIDDRHEYVFVLNENSLIEYWTVDLICNDPKVRAPLQICFMVNSDELEQRFDTMTDLVHRGVTLYNKKDYSASLEVWTELAAFSEWKMFSQNSEIQTWLNHLKRHTFRESIRELSALNSFNVPIPNTLAWGASQNGSIAASGGEDTRLRIWNFNQDQWASSTSSSRSSSSGSGTRLQYLTGELTGHKEPIVTVDLTKDGHFAVTGSLDQTVRIWDLHKMMPIKVIADGYSGITALHFAPDGRIIGFANNTGELTLIDGANGKLLRSVKAHNTALNAFCFCRDGRFFLTGSDDYSFRIFKSHIGELIRKYEGLAAPVTATACAANLRWAFCGLADGKICAFNLISDSKVPSFILEGHLARITALQLLPEDDKIISASLDGTIRFWSLREQKLVHSINNVGPVAGMALNFVGDDLSVITQDSKIRRWNLEWNYTFPGPYHSRNEAEELLTLLIGYFLFFDDVCRNKKGPSEYFTEQTLINFQAMRGKKIPASEGILQKALTEFELRGNGVRTQEEIFDMSSEILNSWPGLRSIRKSLN